VRAGIAQCAGGSRLWWRYGHTKAVAAAGFAQRVGVIHKSLLTLEVFRVPFRGIGLESVYTSKAYRGFESRPVRAAPGEKPHRARCISPHTSPLTEGGGVRIAGSWGHPWRFTSGNSASHEPTSPRPSVASHHRTYR